MWPIVRQARYLGRYREIAQVLAGHGFGLLVKQLGLDVLVSLPRRVLRRHPLESLSAAQRFRMALTELGPTYVKLGQILSTRPDIVPAEFLEQLNLLQDTVPPFPSNVAIAMIEAELGRPISELFVRFDSQPLAAASLGQVHTAELAGGQQVVVKVQRPDIGSLVARDLAIINDLAQLAQERLAIGEQYDLVELAWEFSVSLRAELDYRREGRNAERFRRNFAGNTTVYIPQIHWDLTSMRVLTSERLFGAKINDLPGLQALGIDRKRLARHSTQLILQEIFVDGFFHGDPHPGNFFALPGDVVGAVDFGQVGVLDQRDTAQLLLLLSALTAHDLEGALRALERLNVLQRNQTSPALRRDLTRLIDKVVDQPLSELSARDTGEELLAIFQRHRLHLPAPVAMMLKAVIMMEGIGLQLDPDLDVFGIARPYVLQLVARLATPQALASEVLGEARNTLETLLALPGQSSLVLHQLANGKLQLQVHDPETRRVAGALAQGSARLALALVTAAHLLALALLGLALALGGTSTMLLVLIVLITAGLIFSGIWLAIALISR